MHSLLHCCSRLPQWLYCASSCSPAVECLRITACNTSHTFVPGLCEEACQICQGSESGDCLVARLQKLWDSKIWSWVPRDPEPGMTVLARSSSNLPEWLTTKGAYDDEATRNKICESRAHRNQARGAEQLSATILHACKQLYPCGGKLD
jgi:hypothetical protein